MRAFIQMLSKSADSKGHMHPNVYSSTIDNSQGVERPKCPPTDEWIKKMWFIYTMEYYLAMRKNEILPLQQHRWNWRVLC